MYFQSGVYYFTGNIVNFFHKPPKKVISRGGAEKTL